MPFLRNQVRHLIKCCLVLTLLHFVGSTGSLSAQNESSPIPKTDSDQDPEKIALAEIRRHLGEIQSAVKKQKEAQTKIQKAIEDYQEGQTKLENQVKNLESLKSQLKSIQEITKEVKLQKDGLAKLLEKAIEKLNQQSLPTGFEETLKSLKTTSQKLSSDLNRNESRISELDVNMQKLKASVRGIDSPSVLSSVHVFKGFEVDKTTGLRFKGAIQIHGLSDDLTAFDKISSVEFDDDSKTLILFGDRRGKWLRVSVKVNDDRKAISLEYHERGWIRKSEPNPDHSPHPLGDVESSARLQGELILALDNGDIYSVNNKWVAEKVHHLDGEIEGMAAIDKGQKLVCFAEKQSAGSNQSRKAWILSKGDDKKIEARETAYEFDDDISKRHDVGGATSFNDSVIVVHKHFDEDSETNFLRISKFPANDLANRKSETVLLKAQSKNLLDNTECIICFEQDDKKYLAILTDNNGRSHQKTIFALYEMIPFNQPSRQSGAANN